MSGTLRNPACPNQDHRELCRITVVTTAREPVIDWVIVYNGNGMVVNSDPNSYVSNYSCSVCGIDWIEDMPAGGEHTVTVLPPATKGATP